MAARQQWGYWQKGIGRMETENFAIRSGKEEHIPHCIEIERETSLLFPPDLLPDIVREKRLQLPLFRKAIADNLLWTMMHGDEPIGFSLSYAMPDFLLLAQFHMSPKFSKRGLGTRLLLHTKEKALERNYNALYVTTFENIPWNELFYAKNGFTSILHDELPKTMQRLLGMEARMGMLGRVAMRCVL